MVLFQFGNGWVHGEQLSESAKVHPLLKPYRALSEKVVHPPSYTMHAHTLQTTTPDIQSIFIFQINLNGQHAVYFLTLRLLCILG